MIINKKEILKKICYTELVYARINKKLHASYSKHQIENLINIILAETNEKHFLKLGKNYYIVNLENKIKLTINSNTFRVITADKIKHGE